MLQPWRVLARLLLKLIRRRALRLDQKAHAWQEGKAAGEACVNCTSPPRQDIARDLIPISCSLLGCKLPFLPLQSVQLVTTLSHDVDPP
eukprot:scaffold6004_cov229-Pinguiococcus_pyrenoidosus.AAC.4